jgi:hypothetical protein
MGAISLATIDIAGVVIGAIGGAILPKLFGGGTKATVSAEEVKVDPGFIPKLKGSAKELLAAIEAYEQAACATSARPG